MTTSLCFAGEGKRNHKTYKPSSVHKEYSLICSLSPHLNQKIPLYTVQSPIYEAEHICGSLAESNLADAVMSEDTDACLMTDKEVLRNFKFDEETVEVVDVEMVRMGMGLSREQVGVVGALKCYDYIRIFC